MLPRLILFGLGNPGRRYQGTRHNMGAMVLDALAAADGLSWNTVSSRYSVAQGERGDCRLSLVIPRTYVNASGHALAEFGRHTPFEHNELLVIADDIALPLGQLRLRRRGSDGGHNGLKSIISALETVEFPRLRLGVGPVPGGTDAADFVLERFQHDEQKQVEEQLDRALACVGDVLVEGFEYAMNAHNTAIE